MKKIVALLACTIIATSAFAQGTINFTNLKPSKQIISDAAGAKLEGAWAQLYAGSSADNLAAVGSPVAFYEGKKAGYFSGGVVDAGFNGAGSFKSKLGRVLIHLTLLLAQTVQKQECQEYSD